MSTAPYASSLVVRTTTGPVVGRRTGAVATWRGVPYAAPPVGPLRFRPPVPHAPWRQERLALRPGPASLQPTGPAAPADRLGDGVGEDCLHLDVASPAADGAARPVLVWVHGGAFTSGSGALYDGRALAARGDVVVVSVTYRLGVLGFADLAAATGADVASNLGLRDLVAALEWVRDNAAAFGGDPGRVTVAGESAGSVLVSLLTVAPAARGLFRAAVLSSGTYSLVHGDAVRAEVAGRLARALGLSPRSGTAALQALPAPALLAAQRAVGRAVRGTTAAAPWFDGDVVPADAATARAAVRPDLALLAGANADEVRLFRALRATGTDVLPLARRDLASRLQEDLGPARASAVLARYPRTRAGEVRLGTDLAFALPTAHFAERHASAGGRAWAYRLEAATPWLGAAHAVDLPLLWGWRGPQAALLRGPLTAARRALGERMADHWLHFVRHGAPGPGWPAFGAPERRTLRLRPGGDEVAVDPWGPERGGWAGADVSPRG